jgi:hypothetical protein
MTPEVTLWLASLGGAVLFFAAGRLAGGRKRETAAAVVAPSPTPAAVPGASPDFERVRQELTSARQDAERAAGHLKSELATVQNRLRELTAEDSRLLVELGEARKKAEEALATREELESRAARAGTLETELEERRMEIHRWRDKVTESEARLATAVHPETEASLRQDLSIRSQQLDDAIRRVKTLEEENATLRQDVSVSSGLAVERDHLKSENAELRANQFASKRPTGSRPVALAGGGLTPGGVLQTLVEKVSRLGDIRCAVIADDLGLVVAAHGELSEEVAAVGALFARAGLQAQHVLPLHNVQRVTVEDDQNVQLSLRPLRTDGVKDAELSLITLAVGGGPDPRLVNKLIDEGPRSLLSS